MVTNALTGTPWLAVLSRIKKYSDDDTTRTLASMLYDILNNAKTPEMDDILDRYALKLLGSMT
jgi:hypothetical protein